MSDVMSALHRVLTALAVLGEATPAAIAAQAGLGYSTVSPKLRSLENDELAVRTHDGTGKATWKLTPKGLLAVAVTPDTDTAGLLAGDGALPEESTIAVDAQPQDDTDAAATADAGPQPDAQPPTTGAADSRQLAAPASGRTADTVITAEREPEHAEPGYTTAGDTPDDVAGGQHSDAAATVTTPEPDGEDSTVAADTSPQHEDTVPTRGTGPAIDSEDLVGVGELAAAVPGDSSGESCSGDDSVVTAPAVTGAAEVRTEPVADTAATAPDRPADNIAEVDKPRRPSGQLRAEVLQILKDNPGQTFKVSQMCKAITAANDGPKKQLGGSVANALAKLAHDGQARIVAEKPATYQAS